MIELFKNISVRTKNIKYVETNPLYTLFDNISIKTKNQKQIIGADGGSVLFDNLSVKTKNSKATLSNGGNKIVDGLSSSYAGYPNAYGTKTQKTFYGEGMVRKKKV